MNSGVASKILMALSAMLLVILVMKLDHAEAQAVFRCDEDGLAEVRAAVAALSAAEQQSVSESGFARRVRLQENALSSLQAATQSFDACRSSGGIVPFEDAFAAGWVSDWDSALAAEDVHAEPARESAECHQYQQARSRYIVALAYEDLIAPASAPSSSDVLEGWRQRVLASVRRIATEYGVPLPDAYADATAQADSLNQSAMERKALLESDCTASYSGIPSIILALVFEQ